MPITFLSSHTNPEIVNKTEGITGYGYIVKGTGDTVLLASVKMALRLRWSEQRFAQVLSHVHEVSIQVYSAEGRLSRTGTVESCDICRYQRST